MIRIRSHVDGFRRAGKAHPAKWKEYPDGTFTEKEIKQLEAEPTLQVEVWLEGDLDTSGSGFLPLATGGAVTGTVPVLGANGGEIVLPKYDEITVEQLKARLDELKVDHGTATKKAEYYGLLELAVKKAEG